uniref:protein disulfide-isomerase n=1 Tax=Fibrocapsa japonica TaxID=94617 RepID=A0A7S2V150_9STRA|mmetsp:Transcript_24236/g.35243  ORF Transcript_24236/g.35243 Transcript_24236/m.35243 type:complete len:437 (+) Transcript_24236:112-1422(+)|eukprot:CAMPEP_0113943636 /NCGR_PEP_ID=MMETSP1339-20121228/26944_1 /TAXON_ID=94617 /ORGANISM="Fibrocapsa japonica" /LENGTH=436 /DNA_ID=CAMNT_0000948573 /DNA_START=108 /DNA_END=1418 /DNA_ORIENTATION=- /assembly_acc=CAM_ASM_000762
MAAVLLLRLWLVLAVLIAPSWCLYGPNSDVIQLDEASFKSEVLRGDGVWLVEFYAPWCGHCQRLTPEWEKAAKVLKGVVNVAAVDATQHQQLASRHQVQGYPTIKVFGQDKRKPTDYQGQRAADDIIAAGLAAARKLVKDRQSGKKSSSKSSSSSSSSSKRSSRSDVVELTDSNFEEMVLNSNEQWFVEFYAPWCGHCKKLEPEWKQAATELKGQVMVGAVDATEHKELAATYQIQGFPTLKVFPAGPKTKDPLPYNGPREASDIVQYALNMLEEAGIDPAVPELTKQKEFDSACSGKRICVLAALPHILDSGKSGRNEYIEMLINVAKKLRGKPISLFWFEGGMQVELEASFGLTFGFPALVAVNKEKGAFAVQHGAFSQEGIVSFLNGVMIGKEKTTAVDPFPSIMKVDPWDGEDAAVQEEEFSLDELFADDEL